MEAIALRFEAAIRLEAIAIRSIKAEAIAISGKRRG